MDRALGLQALCFTLTMLASICPPAAAAATKPSAESVLASMPTSSLEDADTMLGLTEEGAVLYEQDPLKLSGYQYCSQAVALAESGELRLSARASGKALYLAKTNNDENLQALASRDLAIAFSYAGQLDKAESFAQEALRLAAKDPQKVVGPAYKVIADVQARRGDYQAAIASYEQALAGASERYKPLVQASLVNALIDSGDLPRARQLFSSLGKPGEPAQVAQTQRTEARLLLAEGHPSQAGALYRQLAEHPPSKDSTYYRAWAWDGVARSEAALGNKQQTAEAYGKALEELDGMRASFHSEEFKMGLFSDVQSIFERAIGFYADQGDNVSAFQASERSRARALRDAVRERSQLPDDMTRSQNLAQLQAALAQDERVVQFHVLPDRLLSWTVGPTVLQSHSVPVDAKGLAQLVEAFRDALANGRQSAVPVADKLGAALIQPLQLKQGQRLIIVPHGPLHYLPFQALREDDAWLIENHPLSLAPSLNIAIGLAQRNAKVPASLTAFGNPRVEDSLDLPGASREVKELAQLFPRNQLFIGTAATKTAFRAKADGSPLLHMAAHAQADRLDPLHSRILLANEGGQRSFLEVSELSGMNLSNTALVTLSACESGLGRVDRGDEVQGFPRGFLMAGSSALIVSLWPVSDDAAELLMRTLYRELARGVDLQRAMQAGQLAVLHQPRSAHPFFWAPFNLIGNWRLTVGE
ncbi:CHAT domain-containing protein [Pseudomonas putida]